MKYQELLDELNKTNNIEEYSQKLFFMMGFNFEDTDLKTVIENDHYHHYELKDVESQIFDYSSHHYRHVQKFEENVSNDKDIRRYIQSLIKRKIYKGTQRKIKEVLAFNITATYVAYNNFIGYRYSKDAYLELVLEDIKNNDIFEKYVIKWIVPYIDADFAPKDLITKFEYLFKRVYALYILKKVDLKELEEIMNYDEKQCDDKYHEIFDPYKVTDLPREELELETEILSSKPVPIPKKSYNIRLDELEEMVDLFDDKKGEFIKSIRKYSSQCIKYYQEYFNNDHSEEVNSELSFIQSFIQEFNSMENKMTIDFSRYLCT